MVIAARSSGRCAGQGRENHLAGLAAGGEHHVAHRLERFDVAGREAELRLQPQQQVGPGQRVHPQVVGQARPVVEPGRAHELLEVVPHDLPRGRRDLSRISLYSRGDRFAHLSRAPALPDRVGHVGVADRAGIVEILQVSVERGSAGGARQVVRLDQLDAHVAFRR
jgi:hypothetical protein